MTTPANAAVPITQHVRDYVAMVQRSLDTIDPAKRESDTDVAMLLSHVNAMGRGLDRLCGEIEDRDALIAGLRAKVATT